MRPPRPPWALTQRAYACAKAGIPGLLVALVSCGAQVITVIVSSPEPPVAPGMTPHPTASDAHATSAAAERAAALTGRLVILGRKVLRMRGLPVMDTHDSATQQTCA
ncbi:hypothetical protein GCM10022295_24100 [Streptomyces osmaniensis]|uniref:Lipoprotein n=1 Tax=Streptomyces osmaniensis TaxID=593134 RepID=A0ABP6VTK2_9ACTN